MGTLITIISSLRNAGAASSPWCLVPSTINGRELLNVLYSEGYISGFGPSKKDHFISVYLGSGFRGADYHLISSLKTMSRPGRKHYITYKELVRCYSNRFCILHTSKGILTGETAISKGIGGELICLRYYFLILKGRICMVLVCFR